jgi:hypothetical protein
MRKLQVNYKIIAPINHKYGRINCCRNVNPFPIYSVKHSITEFSVAVTGHTVNKAEAIERDLLYETGRKNTDRVSDLVLQKPELFEELFQVFAINQEPVSRRAAWVIDTFSEKYPEFIARHLNSIVDLLPTFGHDALKRHSLRILARSPLPSGDRLGLLMTKCFDWLISPAEAPAIKVYCMEILYRISQIEPELKKELSDTIEWRLNEESAGFKSRGRKILCKLSREIEITKDQNEHHQCM